ncbi:arylesterase [Mesorhizobium sp. CU2]|nr:arylesterase [Mesorhizobium sp. CU3]TPO09832.1 arylesterase [Mesorhizobium sp. CU2]
MTEKRQILAFGDSLTWGATTNGRGRHPFEYRWTSVVEEQLPEVRVIAEGLPGRTTCFDDHSSVADRNGARILPTLLSSHWPLDLVAIMLGSNDLKPHLCGKILGARIGIERLVEIVQTYPYGDGAEIPKILIMSPPPFGPTAGGDQRPVGGRDIAESERFAATYREVAEQHACAFFDTAAIAKAADVDGVHLDAANTRAIGLAVAPVIAELLTLSP